MKLMSDSVKSVHSSDIYIQSMKTTRSLGKKLLIIKSVK